MPDITGGLSQGEDVNTQSGFEAALARAAGGEAPAEQTESVEEPTVASGLTTHEQPRDEGGRFEPAATEEPSEETPAAVPAEGAAAEPEVDPTFAAYLERHDGDANAALAAALKERDDSQAFAGRQSNEVGTLREQLARLEGRLDEIGNQGGEPEYAGFPLVTDETVEQLEGLMERSGGRGMMGWVAQNRPDLIEVAEEVWMAGAETPGEQLEASRFAARRQAYEIIEAERQQAPEPQADPLIDSLRQREQFGTLVDAVRQDLGLTGEEWEPVRDEILPAFADESTSPLIKEAIASGDERQQVQGMKDLFLIAKNRASAKSTTAATETVNEQAAKEIAARKSAATVVTGSLRPVQEGQPNEEMTQEERHAAFKKALLGTETTSVSEGLTYAKS